MGDEIVTKVLVKPKKPECYLLATSEVIEAFHPSVVSYNAYVATLINDGKLIVLASELPLGANTPEFKEVWLKLKKNDKNAAASYASLFGQDIHGEKIEVETRGSRKKPEEKKVEPPKEEEPAGDHPGPSEGDGTGEDLTAPQAFPPAMGG